MNSSSGIASLPLLVAALMAIVIASVGGALIYVGQHNQNTDPAQPPLESIQPTPSTVKNSAVPTLEATPATVATVPPAPIALSGEYVLRYRYEVDPQAADPWDAAVVQIDRSSQAEIVVVPSIKQLLPELRDRENHTLFPFTQPSGSLVIFQGVYAETDGGSGPLYAFLPAKGTIQLMQINQVYKGGVFRGDRSISKDQSKLAWVPDSNSKGHEQTMYLIDLIHDTSRVLVRLSGNETFDAATFAGGIGSQHTDLSWLDAQTVRYAVFDQTKKPASTFDGTNILMEYRQVAVR